MVSSSAASNLLEIGPPTADGGPTQRGCWSRLLVPAAPPLHGGRALGTVPLALGSLGQAHAAVVEPLDGTLEESRRIRGVTPTAGSILDQRWCSRLCCHSRPSRRRTPARWTTVTRLALLRLLQRSSGLPGYRCSSGARWGRRSSPPGCWPQPPAALRPAGKVPEPGPMRTSRKRARRRRTTKRTGGWKT